MRLPIFFVTACAGALLLAGCATPPPARPDSWAMRRSGSAESGQIVFTAPNALSTGAWTVKRGATLTLGADGKGVLSFRAFCGGDPLPRELGAILLVYGKDGNRLFAVPPKDGGLIVRAVDPKWDVPVDFQFGFDPRHFAHASSAKIFLLAKGEVISD